jgi:hypothetical protein
LQLTGIQGADLCITDWKKAAVYILKQAKQDRDGMFYLEMA